VIIYCVEVPGVYKVFIFRKHSLNINVLCMYSVYLSLFVWRVFR